MKRRGIALILVLCVLFSLTGCGSGFERTVHTVTPHQEQSASQEDGSILHAENYANLVSCVQHFVFMGQPEGTVRIYKYSGDIEADLRSACREVLTEDPLGAYALNDITFTYDRIVSYYECTFHFDFRHTKQEISSVVNAYGDASIRKEIRKTMSSFGETLTFRTANFYADRTNLYKLAQEAYYSSPGTAMGYPSISISVYPDSGDVQIVEMQFSYGYSLDEMKQRADAAASAAAQIMGQETAANGNVAELLCSRLLQVVTYDPHGGASVYDALCLGTANSEAIALSYQLLCKQADIPCRVVQGTQNGVPHFWNIVDADGTHWHVDLTSGAPEQERLCTDYHMLSLGYYWSKDDYPRCDGASDVGSNAF